MPALIIITGLALFGSGLVTVEKAPETLSFKVKIHKEVMTQGVADYNFNN